jgi:biofilm PGA synthesis N-glycosyltransferase PgaC
MLKLLVFYSLMIISLIHIVHIGLYVIGANIYDIRKLVRRGRARQAAPYNPLVSVVIPAHNEQTGVVRTIKTVLANTYKNVEIIVVDDGSTDNTAQIVRSFIRQNYASNNPLRYFGRSGRAHNLERRFIRGTYGGPRIVLVRQLNAGKGAAVTNGIKNYANGELIMTLDADSLLYKRAINNAVAYFRDPKVLGVAANVQVMDNGTALSVLQKIEHLIGYRSKKFYSVANCEMIIGGVASTYRASTLRQVGYYDTDTVTEDIGLSMKVIAENGNKDYRLEYGVDVVALYRSGPVI